MFKAAAQRRQEVKQKAKRVVEKEFLTFRASGGASKQKKAMEARINFLKKGGAFHHGNLDIPSSGTDPSVCNSFLAHVLH